MSVGRLISPLWVAGSAGPTSNMSLEENRKFVRAEWQVLSAVAYLMGFQVDNWTEYWLINAFRLRQAGSPNEGMIATRSSASTNAICVSRKLTSTHRRH